MIHMPKPGMKRLTVGLPEDVWDRLAEEAASKGIPIGRHVARLIVARDRRLTERFPETGASTSTRIQQKVRVIHMSDHLLPSLPERRVWPFALHIKQAGSRTGNYFHYATIPAALLMANLCADEMYEVRWFVANTDPHVLHSSAVGVGWFEVGNFNPSESAEVRAALRWQPSAPPRWGSEP